MPTAAPSTADRLEGVRVQLAAARSQLLGARSTLADLCSDIDAGLPLAERLTRSLRCVTDEARSTQ